MSEHLRPQILDPSEFIVFKVKYRKASQNYTFRKEANIDEMVASIVESFFEDVNQSNSFRLGIFSGDALITYINNSNLYLLNNDVASLLRAPDIASKELVSFLACMCECLQYSSRWDEVSNLSERSEESLNYLYCEEFAKHFICFGGVDVLFRLINSICQCGQLKMGIRRRLWRQTLRSLTALIKYDEVALESERAGDILDFPFTCQGLYWPKISDDTLSKIIRCYDLTDDPTASTNCILILLSFVKACPERVGLLVTEEFRGFLEAVLESCHPTKGLPPLPHSVAKLSRSNSRQDFRVIRPRTLSPSGSATFHTIGSPMALSPSAGVVEANVVKKRRVSELQVLAVCLVHAIYSASVEELMETLMVLPPDCIVSVVADLLSPLEAVERPTEWVLSPQADFRDDVTNGSRGIFSSLRLRGSFIASRISRMNSAANESVLSQFPPSNSQNPLTAPSNQSSGQQTLTHRPFVDATPITDEKQVPVFTDPVEINLRDMLISLQHYLVQPYSRLMEETPTANQVRGLLEKTVNLIASKICPDSPKNPLDENLKKDIYKMLYFSNPQNPEEEFLQSPKMLIVVCLSDLLKHREKLIERILVNQGAFEDYKQRQMPSEAKPKSILSWLGTDKSITCPIFPLIPGIIATARVLCENFGLYSKIHSEDEQLNILLFQSPHNADSVFLELYLLCFDAFYDIWFTLDAAPCNLNTIAEVLSTCVKNALESSPSTFGEFARNLANFSPDSIQQEWQMYEEEREKNHPAIQELHRDLVKLHTETVTQQRLNTMCNGPPLIYLKQTKRDIQRLQVSLSADRNLLLARNSHNHVVEIWPISSIISISVHPDSRKKGQRDWSIFLVIDNEPPTEHDMDILSRPQPGKQSTRHNSIQLIAPSEYIQTAWIDGFSCLRHEKFTSAAFADDMNMLSNLELRIRLFGLNLDTVPTKPIERPLNYPDLEGLTF